MISIKSVKFLTIVSAMILISAVLGCEAGGAGSGEKAYLFSAETFSHGAFSLDETTDQPVVINFWFPSCPPCRTELPDLEVAYQKYKGLGVSFIGVQQLGLDSEADGRRLLAEIGVTYPNFADDGSSVQIGYEVLGYPTTVFVDREQRISRVWSGLIRPADLDREITRLLEQ